MKRFLFAIIVGYLGAVLFVPFVSCFGAEETDAQETPLASAVIVTERIEDGVRKTSMFIKIADKYAEAGEKDKALEVLSRALEAAKAVEYPLHKAQALAQVAEKFAQAGEKDKATEILSQALEVARGIEYPVYRAEALAEIAVRYARVGKRDKALQILFQAREAGKTIKNLRLQTEVWVNILVKYVEIGEYGIALGGVRAARGATFKANTLIKIATKCAELGDKDKALEVLSLAHEAAKEITHPPYKAGRLRKIAAKYAEYGEKDKQQEVLSQAFEAAKTIEDTVYKARVLTNIAVKYAQAGDKDNASKTLFEAFQVAKIIESPDGKFRRLLRIADKFAEYEEKDKALEVLSEALEAARAIKPETIGDTANKVEELVEVAVRYAQVGEKDKALEVLSQAHNAAKRITFSFLKEDALSEIATAYAKVGEFSQALELIKKIKSDSEKGWALAEIAEEYAEVGQYDEALKLVGKIRDSDDKDEALTRIAVKYAEAGQYDQALKLLGPTRDSYYKEKALAEIAGMCAKAAEEDRPSEALSRAFERAKRIERAPKKEESDEARAWKTYVSVYVAGKYAEAGEYTRALETAKAIEEPFFQAWVLAEIGLKCAEAGDKDKASEMLSGALEAAKGVEDAHDKSEVLLEISDRYTQAGEKLDERASKILAEIIRQEQALRLALGQKALKADEEVRKNVEEFIKEVARTDDESVDETTERAYNKLVSVIWQEKDPNVLDQYLTAFREYPWPKARYSLDSFPSDLAGYYVHEPPGWPESPYRWKIIQWAIEEIERAKKPRVPTSTEISRNVEEYFNEMLHGMGLDYNVELMHLAINSGEEGIIKEYAAAIRQHPWPYNYQQYEYVHFLGHACWRLEVEFLVYLLDHPKERKAYFQRLQAKKTGNFQVTPIVRKNVEKYLEAMSSELKGGQRDTESGLSWSILRSNAISHFYIKALKDVPWPEDKKVREEMQSKIDYAVEEMEGQHFNIEKMLWVGFPEYRARARKDVEQFYLELIQEKDKKGRRKVARKFLDKVAGPGKKPSVGLLYEYALAFVYVPRPAFGDEWDVVYMTAQKIEELLAKAAVEEIEWPEFPPEVEEFFKGIASEDPLERKGAVFMLLPEFTLFGIKDESQELVRDIKRHPLPEEEMAKQRLETVLEVFEEQADFFSDRWWTLASPSGNEEHALDETGTVSQWMAAIMFMAKDGMFKVDHWPSIIRDKNRPLMDRFYAGYYLAKYYSFLDTSTGKGKADLSMVRPEERPMFKAMIELRGKFEKEIERLRADEDKTLGFLIDLGFAHQQFPQDFKPYVPALIEGLESDYLYFRILSQHRLEELTRQQFPLDPTDPPELRAPAIEQWQKWWSENKDKLRYDPMKDRLVE